MRALILGLCALALTGCGESADQRFDTGYGDGYARLTFDPNDAETIAYDAQALVLVLSEAAGGPHCRAELELSEEQRNLFNHGQVILLAHVLEGI